MSRPPADDWAARGRHPDDPHPDDPQPGVGEHSDPHPDDHLPDDPHPDDPQPGVGEHSDPHPDDPQPGVGEHSDPHPDDHLPDDHLPDGPYPEEHYPEEHFADELLPEHAHGEEFGDHDASLADDVLAEGVPEDEAMFRPPRHKKRSPVLRIGAIVAALAIVLVGGFYGFSALRNMIPDISFGSAAPEDFEGSGSGEVLVDIPAGVGGGEIGMILFDAGVVASAEAFSNTAAADPRSTGIQPGTYVLAENMSAGSALERLVDPDSRQSTGVTIREGLWRDEVFAILAESTDHEVEDYEAVDPASLDLPDAANGELEGYLYPDTYDFSPTSTPEEQLQAMIDLGARRYEELGLGDADLHDVIIKASIVQGEGMFAEDLPKVARVMENRLAGDSETNGHLQMDSTVHFIYQERGRAGTTEEQRANESPYNTYVHTGLPPGPINSPGAVAIEAAMNPAEGDWLYFVTVNPSTGETVFTNTLSEHNKAVEQFEQWCADNPDSC